MPTYDYVCENGHEFHIQQKITEDALTKCPLVEWQEVEGQGACGTPCKRVINFGGGVIFKGSGWTPKGK